jgi:hypothetical protein
VRSRRHPVLFVSTRRNSSSRIPMSCSSAADGGSGRVEPSLMYWPSRQSRSAAGRGRPVRRCAAISRSSGVGHRPAARSGGCAAAPRLRSVAAPPLSSRTFSIRCTCRERSRVKAVRARVRSRSSRIGCGGTSDPRSNPCAPRSASYAAPQTDWGSTATHHDPAVIDRSWIGIGVSFDDPRPTLVTGIATDGAAGSWTALPP